MNNDSNIKNTEVNIFLAKVQTIINMLDEIDGIIANQPQKTQRVDYMLSDYLHLIQHESLNIKSQHEVCEKIKESRMNREDLNNLNILCKVFENNQQKLSYSNSRKFLYNELMKTIKNFNQPYNYRVLTEEELDSYKKEDNIVEIEPKKEKRVYIMDNQLTKDVLIEELKNKTAIEIAKEYNVNKAHVYYLIQKYKIGR